MKEAQRWLSQAQNDLAVVHMSVREGFYAHACFMSQQATEKALKALAYLKGDRFVPGHSVRGLLDDLITTYPELASVQDGAERLDQYYVPTRYPDALPGGAPFEVYRREQSEEAVTLAESIIQVVARLVSREAST
jgi:HEPN domain-containing protein